MILARIFTKIYKEGGIILIDAKGQKYICGNPKKDKPITLKLLKDNLGWKILLDPELEAVNVKVPMEMLLLPVKPLPAAYPRKVFSPPVVTEQPACLPTATFPKPVVF